MEKTFVISLGGSIVVPEPGKIDSRFLKKFRQLVLKFAGKGRRFVIIVGGGKTCRLYQKSASEISKISPEQLDWLGIQATKLNAYLLKTIFKEKAWPDVLDNPNKNTATKLLKKPVIIAAGWKPGRSTDYMAVLLAKKFKADTVINASNISFLYDKDIRIHKEAKKIPAVDWAGYRKIVGDKWKPGASFPFDPVAAREAEKSNLKVIIVKGTDLKNLEKILNGGKFKGTLIKND
jgi:uridylate kinase